METVAKLLAIITVGFFAGFGFWLAKGVFNVLCIIV